MKKKKIRTWIILAVLVVVFISGFLFWQNGKKRINEENENAELTNIGQFAENGSENDIRLRKGEVLYDGKIYRFNRDVISVLIMGIDKTVKEGITIADPMFLLVMNPHLKKTLVIAINRDAMAEVDIYEESGNPEKTVNQQISTQFAYGDGRELSCERQVNAVSRFLHDLPINGYAAIDMKAVPLLTDSLGGISVTVLEDMDYPECGMNLKAGEEFLLTGEDAYNYVHLESNDPMDNYDMRFDRQKQYMTTFLAQAKNQASKDITIALNLYKTMNESKVTDISLSEFTYLVTESVTYEFDISNMYSLEGEYVNHSEKAAESHALTDLASESMETGETDGSENVQSGGKMQTESNTQAGENADNEYRRFREFVVDEQALEKMLIEVFYEPVEE